MKVAIYGGSGFIGAWITKFCSITIFKLQYLIKKLIKIFLIVLLANVEKIDFVEGDILEYETVLKTAKDHSVLINLVGLMTPIVVIIRD